MPDVGSTSLPQVPLAGVSAPSGVSTDSRESIQKWGATLDRLLNFRRPFDVRRSLFYRQWIGQRDQQYFPDGITPRNNTFATYPWSNVETIVSRVVDAYFGYEDWFECRGRGENDGDAAEKMQLVLKYLLRSGHITRAFTDLVRNIAIYGHAGIKVEWDHGFELLNIKEPIPVQDAQGQPVIDPQTGQPAIQGYQLKQVQVPKAKPRFIAIDIYDILVDPDGLFVGMMADKTFAQLKQEQEGYSRANPGLPPLYSEAGMQLLEQKLSNTKDPNAVIIRLAEIWDTTNNTYVLMTAKDAEAIAWKDRRLAYRLASYSGYRAPVYGGEPIIFYEGENQFNHKMCPILHTGYVVPPNEPYGIGVIEPTAEQVESLSKFMNMIVDNWNLGINRRYAYDINANIDHEALNRFNTPGGKVPVDGDPRNVIAPLPFFTPEGGDYTLLDMYRSLIEMTSGISDFYTKGIGGPQGNETATGISSVINESNYKFRMFIQNLELFIMQPLLTMCASMVQQYLPDEIEVALTDAQPGIPKYQSISPQELIGNYSFELVASQYVTNKIVKQRNLMAFVNVVGGSPYWNQYEGLKTIAKAFEIPNINRLLKTPEQVQQEQQQQLQQQIQLQELLAQHEQRRQNEQIILSGAVGAHKAREQAKDKAKATGRAGGGRPAKVAFEGKIPGIGATGPARETGQQMGANALGLEGLGEIGQG